MDCQQIGLDLLRAGTGICLRLRHTTALNRIQASTHFNNPFLGEVLHRDLAPVVGEVLPLPLEAGRGVHHQRPLDLFLGGVDNQVVAVHGVDGVPPNQTLLGLEEEAVLPLGLNHPHR